MALDEFGQRKQAKTVTSMTSAVTELEERIKRLTPQMGTSTAVEAAVAESMRLLTEAEKSIQASGKERISKLEAIGKTDRAPKVPVKPAYVPGPAGIFAAGLLGPGEVQRQTELHVATRQLEQQAEAANQEQEGLLALRQQQLAEIVDRARGQMEAAAQYFATTKANAEMELGAAQDEGARAVAGERVAQAKADLTAARENVNQLVMSLEEAMTQGRVELAQLMSQVANPFDEQGAEAVLQKLNELRSMVYGRFRAPSIASTGDEASEQLLAAAMAMLDEELSSPVNSFLQDLAQKRVAYFQNRPSFIGPQDDDVSTPHKRSLNELRVMRGTALPNAFMRRQAQEQDLAKMINSINMDDPTLFDDITAINEMRQQDNYVAEPESIGTTTEGAQQVPDTTRTRESIGNAYLTSEIGLAKQHMLGTDELAARGRLSLMRRDSEAVADHMIKRAAKIKNAVAMIRRGQRTQGQRERAADEYRRMVNALDIIGQLDQLDALMGGSGARAEAESLLGIADSQVRQRLQYTPR